MLLSILRQSGLSLSGELLFTFSDSAKTFGVSRSVSHVVWTMATRTKEEGRSYDVFKKSVDLDNRKQTRRQTDMCPPGLRLWGD